MSTLFNIYDYIFFAFILFFALVGLMRGFWVQLFAVIVWLASVACYYIYAPTFEHGFLSQYMSQNVAHWFSLAVILVGACILNFILRFLVSSIFKVNPFTFFNKVGGFILGGCASALIVILMIYALNASPMGTESTDWEKSYIVTKITPTLDSFKEHNDNKTSFGTTATSSNTTISQVGNTEEMA